MIFDLFVTQCSALLVYLNNWTNVSVNQIACFLLSGKALITASNQFFDDPCCPTKRQKIVKSADSLFGGVTRMLYVADIADALRLKQSLNQVRNFNSYLWSRNNDDLGCVHAFKHCSVTTTYFWCCIFSFKRNIWNKFRGIGIKCWSATLSQV